MLPGNTHYIFCHIYKINNLSNFCTDFETFLIKSTWTWRRNRESVDVCTWATYVFLSFSNMACSFNTFAGVNSNGLFIKEMYLTIEHDVEHQIVVYSIYFQQYASHRDRLTTDLRMCKSSSLSWNQLLKLDQLSTIITLAIQAIIRQKYHRKKRNFNNFSAMYRWGGLDQNRFHNLQK